MNQLNMKSKTEIKVLENYVEEYFFCLKRSKKCLHINQKKDIDKFDYNKALNFYLLRHNRKKNKYKPQTRRNLVTHISKKCKRALIHQKDKHANRKMGRV